MPVIKDIVEPRNEIIEGRFQGVLQSHKVEAGGSQLESNPEEFLKITYLSSGLKRTFERINEKLTQTSNQGGFLLVGPYGSGKTHGLISLYHAITHPEISKDWLRNWGIEFSLPDSTKTVIMSTRRYDVDLLWEPIFKLLGREDVLSSIKRFPTIDQIEEVIGDAPCAIFIDEIENWYGSFDPETQAHLIEQNETFLEHLLEVANDPKKNLLVFITFLEEKEGVKKIFNRTNPVRVDITAMEDREKVVLHRLFEHADKKDLDKVEEIAEKYVEKYNEPIQLDNAYKFKQRIMRTYPFHPLLLDTLIQIYEAATERQDIRGMMNVLADAVKAVYDKKDLILLSDIDENVLRGMDLHLVEKVSYDLDRIKEIAYGREILKTVLIFTLNEKTVGATESDILLSVFSPTQGHTLNAIVMDLENIYGKPHYLHKEDGIYLFKHEINIFALLEREKKKINEDVIKERIKDIVKKEIFENRVFIQGYEDIPDDSKLKIVVDLESWGTNDVLKSKLAEFNKGKTWQNTYIIVFPTIDNIFSYDIVEKAGTLKAAEKLVGQVEDKEKRLQKVIADERKEIVEKIKGFYGFMIKWVERDNEVVPRLINVGADVTAVREKAGSDSALVGDRLIEEIKDKADGQRIELLISDFKKFRRYPQILDDEVIYTAIRNLHRDKRVVIQGERGKWYVDESPRSLELGFVIFDPKYYTYTPPSEGGSGETGAVTAGGEEYGGAGEQPEVERRERKTLELRGNSPRVILSQVEARSREKDVFKEISATYKFKNDLDKQKIMKFIKQLPQEEEADIEGEVVLWREKDEA
mgnify:CR=1 FL=1